MPPKKNHVPLTRRILDELLPPPRLFGAFLSVPRRQQRMYLQSDVSLKDWSKLQETLKQRRALKDLRKKKWMKERREGNRVIIEFSTDAVIARLKDYIRSYRNKLTGGQVCLVMFDFPNGANAARNMWRSFLVSIGCTRVQLSVWQTDKDVAEELATLSRLLRAEKWVKIYMAKENGGKIN